MWEGKNLSWWTKYSSFSFLNTNWIVDQLRNSSPRIKSWKQCKFYLIYFPSDSFCWVSENRISNSISEHCVNRINPSRILSNPIEMGFGTRFEVLINKNSVASNIQLPLRFQQTHRHELFNNIKTIFMSDFSVSVSMSNY